MKRKGPSKWSTLAVVLLALLCFTCATSFAEEVSLEAGVNIIRTGAVDKVYNIDTGKAVMICGTDAEPIRFENCTFNLSGETVRISGNQDGISYNNGEVVTKLWIGENVQFDNCIFVSENGGKSTGAGYDASIYFFSGDIVLKGCTLTGNGWNGQFLGLYGSKGSVTFDDCDISTVGNRNGWSYAMYGGSVLKLLNGSTMTATGMTVDSGNINAFYSGDNRTGYDAIYVKDSTIDFSDNQAGGFAINNVNIYVENSDITVNNNLGNACNSGYWIVSDDSSITMNGNRGGHALSCIGFEMSNSKLEVLHNGYAGVYVQSRDSSFTNCEVNIHCNGEKLLSYTAGDVWLNGHTLTITDSASVWLGAVGRKGSVVNNNSTVVAYDLNSNAVDNLKSNTAPILNGVNIALNDEADKHTLFLNPFMASAYARGNAENTQSDNDADLFETDVIGEAISPKPVFASDEEKRAYIIGGSTAKIGELTTAQLSHHKYDWENGEVIGQATNELYGVKRYTCTDVCAGYVNNAAQHPYGFNCEGTYVYAPLVGLAFNANADNVTNMPENQTSIEYGAAPVAPEQAPERFGYTFTGWYTDSTCTQAFDFAGGLTQNWTEVYAGWRRSLDVNPDDNPPTDLPIDKTASERLDEDYRAEVTLTMPSYAEPLETDVVFVLDKSTSTQVEEDALSMLDRLRAQVEGKQAIVKVGVVIFNRQANTNGLLMDLTSEYETIKNEIGKDISSGTNSHAGLMAGMDLLNGGGAANSRKYLIFVSDGKTYIFGEEPTAIPLQNADRTNAFAGPDNWATKYGNDTPPASWDAYFAEIAAQIAADDTQYYVPYGTNTPYISYEERLEHANSVDVALYRTNEVYQAAKSAGYRVFAKLKSSDIGANYLWGPAFMEYLSGGQEVSFEGIGDDMLYLYGAGTTITDVIGYGETAEHGPYDFGFVDENLMLKYGTVDDQGNFTPFGDYNPYCVSSEMDGNGNVHYYFGQGLAEDGAGYAFELIHYPNGVPGATAENDQKEHFTLTFHRNIRLGEQVQLTYNVELGENYRNKQDANLFDGLETNKNAYIDPVDSEGNAGDRQFFPVPTTEYENVHVAKVWAGDDDAAVRPNSITVTLKEPVGGTIRETSAAVDASTGWAALFLNVRKGWEIEEVQVVLDAGKGSYTSSQTAEAGNASDVTLTNTYTKPEPTPTVTPIPTPTPTPAPVLPETVVTIIKVWDDSGYSGRPNAITVRLGVQNDPNYVGYNVELSPNNPNVRVSADGNTWTWSRQIVDRAYVAEEVAVPGYASKVEQNGNTFVITNTYMPATGDDTPVRTYLLIAGCAAMVLLGTGAWLLHSRRGKRA